MESNHPSPKTADLQSAPLPLRYKLPNNCPQYFREQLTICGHSLKRLSSIATYFSGRCEIRTHGAFTPSSFQDWCDQPDSANLPLSGE